MPSPSGRDRPTGPDWPLWIAPAAIAVGFVAGSFVTVFVAAIGGVSGSQASHPGTAISLIGSVLFDLAFVGAAIYFASVRGGARPADFGFRRLRLWHGIAAVLVAGGAYYGLSALYGLLFHLRGSDKLPFDVHGTTALVAVTAFVCVLAPILEEFFFRGFIFGVLRRMHVVLGGREIGTWIAAVVTGVLFGLAHTESASARYLIPLGFFGFVLCLVRWQTKSLYPCMALHSINNSLALQVSRLHWNPAEILALIVGSVAVIAVLTGPLTEGGRLSGGLGARARWFNSA